MKEVGEIFPVIKDQHGNILDGFHRKRVNPNWRETTVEVRDELHALRIRVHANVLRRNIDWKEGHEWVLTARKLLNPNNPDQPTVREIGEALGVSKTFVVEHDTWTQASKDNVDWKEHFYGYNVWGFKDDGWRKLVVENDPNQPDKEFYHGSTPAFIIHQLIQMFQPKTVLDSMAGVGTTGYVCEQHGIQCDMFDVYPYPKYNVLEKDAEYIDDGKHYDLIFNHIPYLDMVRYGEGENDLSTMNEKDFFEKLKRIMLKNYTLLNPTGIYAILVGDWRCAGKIVPITAKCVSTALESGFMLYDEAVKLTAEQKGLALQEYRASKSGYLAQTFDMVLIFKRGLNYAR